MTAADPDHAIDVLDSPDAGGTAIRGTALRSAGLLVTFVLGIASAPLLTRHLGVQEFGRYTAVFSLVTLVTLVTEGGLGSYGVREMAGLSAERRATVLRDLVGMRIAFMGAGSLFAIAFAAVAGYGGRLVLGTALASVGAFAYAAQGVLALPLAADLRLGWITVGEVVRQAVFVVAVATCVILGAGVVPLLGATIPAGAAGTLAMAWAYRGRGPVRPSFRISRWRPILRQAIPLGVAGAIYSAYFRVVILIMSIVATAVATGYFALSFRVVEVLVGIPFLVTSAFIPIFARAAGTRDDDRLQFAMSRTFDVAVLAGAGLTLLTFAGAPLAMAVLTGDPGSPAADVLRIQAFTLLAVFLNATYGTVLVALRRHRDLVAMSTGTLAVTAVLAGVLVPLWGETGGAVASVTGEWLLTIAGVAALRRARPQVRAHPRVAVRALPAAVAAGAAALVVDVPHLPDLGPPVVAGLVYIALVVLLRGVPPELTDALLRRRAPTSPA